jgi:hypothetical protein
LTSDVGHVPFSLRLAIAPADSERLVEEETVRWRCKKRCDLAEKARDHTAICTATVSQGIGRR